MPATFRKDRKLWESRVSFQGKRYYVGSFKSKKLAEAAELKKRNELEQFFKKNTLENKKLNFEKPRKTNKTWLSRVRSWRSNRRRDRAVERAIENL